MPSVPGVIAINGVDCTLFIPKGDTTGVITEAVSATEPPTAKLTFKCPWKDRYKVLVGLGGGVSGTAAAPVRVAPFPYPDSPNLRVIAIPAMRSLGPMVWDPSVGTTGWYTFQFALIDCVFGVYPWLFQAAPPDGQNDPSGVPYLTVRVRGSSDVVVPEGVQFQWQGGVDAGKQINGAGVGFIRPKHEIAITQHWMPAVPVAYLNTFSGKLNPEPIVAGDWTYPPGFLMYHSFNATESTDTLGNRTFEVEHIILAQTDAGWNSFIARDGTYQGVATAGGVTPFGFADWYTPLAS